MKYTIHICVFRRNTTTARITVIATFSSRTITLTNGIDAHLGQYINIICINYKYIGTCIYPKKFVILLSDQVCN